jgi:hypothetical protein
MRWKNQIDIYKITLKNYVYTKKSKQSSRSTKTKLGLYSIDGIKKFI